MKHCPRAVSIARPSTLQHTALPSELAAAPHHFKGLHGTGEIIRPKECVSRVAGSMQLKRLSDLKLLPLPSPYEHHRERN